MSKNYKTVALIIITLIIGGSATAYFMWNKPHRDVADEKGIQITAAQLVKDYQASEAEANKKYLDKAIQVTGSITEVKPNQEGKTTIMLGSDDAFTGVFCTLKEKSNNLQNGSTVTIKGICSGMLSDVRLSDAVIVK